MTELEELEVEIEARIEEMKQLRKSGDDSTARLIIESENRLMLSKLRKLKR